MAQLGAADRGGAARAPGRGPVLDLPCVNWLRTLPYVAAWAERYADRGLVVVGAHAPEFGFEHDLGNVRRAAAEPASRTRS